MRKLSIEINSVFLIMAKIALLSVSNKQGLVPFARTLSEIHGYQIISSGGTAKLLESENIEVCRVSEYTGAPEILEGRVKTLHPKIHGGILANRNKISHKNDLEKQNIKPIDLVVVNLYPFKETIAKPSVEWEEAIENIDIGGPAMIRAAAKNHLEISVLTRPDQYNEFLKALEQGEIPEAARKELALQAFEHTAAYDITISNWISNKIKSKSSSWFNTVPLKQNLRYGENPHQSAKWYSNSAEGLGGTIQIQGKELSTNNLLDLEAALSTVKEFGYGTFNDTNCIKKAAVVIKHTNPCGVAISDSIENAFHKALEADSISAFGGIVALNSNVNEATANKLTNIFLECVIAPSFDEKAKSILSKKQNLRVLELNPEALNSYNRNHIRSILGGLIVQEKDDQTIDTSEWEIVTKQAPNNDEMEDLKFAWKIVRHVRSNAITIASCGQSLGIGAGQMNRIGAAKIALEAAKEKTKDAVLASDGFFPFDDTVKLAAKYGISSIIQPGGSIKDQDSISTCNELGIKMVFTNRRHFLH